MRLYRVFLEIKMGRGTFPRPMQIAQFILCPAVHDFQHGILLVAPMCAAIGIDKLTSKRMLQRINHAQM